MKTFGVLHGPNLDRLGTREPSVYGAETLAHLEGRLRSLGEALGVTMVFAQSNHEGTLVERLWQWRDEGVAGVLLNLGAFTHTSIAIRDALAGSELPAVEVHLSNVFQRERFRHHSHVSDLCLAVVSGLHFEGYDAAVRYLAARIG